MNAALPVEPSLTDPARPQTLDEALSLDSGLPRGMGWRLRALVVLMLLSVAALTAVSHWLTRQPAMPLMLRASADGLVRVVGVERGTDPRLEGHAVLSIGAAIDDRAGSEAASHVALSPLMLERSARWIVATADRERHVAQMGELAAMVDALPRQGGLVRLTLDGGETAMVRIEPRGWGGLPVLYWMLSLLGVAVSGVGVLVFLAGPQWRNAAFAVLAMAQGATLVLMAAGSALELLKPPAFILLELALRQTLDVLTGVSLLLLALLHPRKMHGWRLWCSLAVAASASALWALHLLDARHPGASWWSHQMLCLSLVALALGVMGLARRWLPHPFTVVMQRFVGITALTWLALSLALVVSGHRADLRLNLTTFAVMAWHVFVASQVLLSPYLLRSRPVLQEFSLLAASSTVAAAMDLTFVAVFALGPFTATALSLFLAFGLYLGLRRAVMGRLRSREPMGTERLFERLYRMARELERRPDRLVELMSRLLRELFEPMELLQVQGQMASATLKSHGAVLVVPVPRLLPAEAGSATGMVCVLRHAEKGRRLFTADDARLVDRINDQLHRVLTYDRAVEQGRSEERTRLAQDLHDDIGARLLTLMYQAPNPDIEEYIRHTLQDLKTLTRGLSVQGHTLVAAASEWKRDLDHRARVARCQLQWSQSVDHDVPLSVVQWSALTRILRELANNTISHARATVIRVDLSLVDDVLKLSVSDDGLGHSPQGWSHGLGLGGVRKRVKQLGGTVSWQECEPRGIACEVVVERFSAEL